MIIDKDDGSDNMSMKGRRWDHQEVTFLILEDLFFTNNMVLRDDR